MTGKSLPNKSGARGQKVEVSITLDSAIGCTLSAEQASGVRSGPWGTKNRGINFPAAVLATYHDTSDPGCQGCRRWVSR